MNKLLAILLTIPALMLGAYAASFTPTHMIFGYLGVFGVVTCIACIPSAYFWQKPK